MSRNRIPAVQRSHPRRCAICDEPVASLDVSIQAQIINLFLTLTKKLNLTCVFISHDLSIVQHVSDRVAVMYLGRIVELGPVAQIFGRPAHPYTAALFGSVPNWCLKQTSWSISTRSKVKSRPLCLHLVVVITIRAALSSRRSVLRPRHLQRRCLVCVTLPVSLGLTTGS